MSIKLLWSGEGLLRRLKFSIFAFSENLDDMKTIRIDIPTAADAEKAARELVNNLGDSTVVAFKGEMGAGKTTLINAICWVLGVSAEETSSPTFAIINEYRSDTTAELIYHFDCYRLETLDEALEIGVDDYFWSGALCLVEWPEVIADLLPEDTVVAHLKVNDDDSRTLQLSLPEE